MQNTNTVGKVIFEASKIALKNTYLPQPAKTNSTRSQSGKKS